MTENMPNYKVFKIVEGKKQIVCKFYAGTDEKANEYLVKNYGDEEELHYWGRHCTIRVPEDDGTLHEYEDYDDALKSRKPKNIIVQALVAVKDFFSKWFYDKPKDWWIEVKDMCFLLKNGYRRCARWDFDTYLLELMEKVIPHIRDNAHGLSPKFLDMAITQLHGSDEGFDLAEYHKAHCSRYPKDVEDLALGLANKTYDEIVLHIKLYTYYFNYGIASPEFDKQWHHTLPIKPGSYDEFDYPRLQALIDREWNAIWDMMKEYGQTMWD